MGFKPVVTDVKEFREAIASGRIDAQENPLTNMLNFGIEQHHRHLSLTSHLFGVALLACGREWHDGLGLAQRNALLAAVREATRLQHRLATNEDALALKVLEAAGLSVLRPHQIDLEGFLEATAPVREGIIDRAPTALSAAYSNV